MLYLKKNFSKFFLALVFIFLSNVNASNSCDISYPICKELLEKYKQNPSEENRKTLEDYSRLLEKYQQNPSEENRKALEDHSNLLENYKKSPTARNKELLENHLNALSEQNKINHRKF